MPTQLHSSFSILFQQIFAAFCALMADLYIFLFFQNLASNSHTLLIMNPAYKIKNSNRIQREFLFNNCIQSHNCLPASSHSRQITNFYKRTLIQMALYRHLNTSHSRQITNLYKLFLCGKTNHQKRTTNNEQPIC
jgi:hypothetical protein